jgi:hypothetical protein
MTSAALERAMARRGITLSQTQAIQAQNFRVHGTIEVPGPGEGTHPVKFPVSYIERPKFSYGGVLGDNTALVAGNFPQYSVWVLRWEVKELSPEQQLYEGCTLAIQIAAPANTRASIDWQFEGSGLRSPTTASDDSGVVI